MNTRDTEIEKLEGRIISLEQRLSLLEATVNVQGTARRIFEPEEYPEPEKTLSSNAEDDDKGIESAIGRVGLAWLGTVVLLLGILFFTEYLNSKGNPVLSAVIGYLSVAAIWFLARYLRRSNPGLYLMFGITGLIIGFYLTMRLYFFSAIPLLPSKTITVVLMLGVTAYSVYLSLSRKIQGYATLALIFTIVTSVVSDSTHVMLPLATIAAAGSVWYFYKCRWRSVLVFSVILSYIVFLFWLISNPLMKHELQLLKLPEAGYVYLFITAACFSLLTLLRDPEKTYDEFLISMTVIHGILFTILLALVTVSFFKEGYVLIYSGITVAALGYAIFLKKRGDWNFPAAFFSLYGFMAMSIALYGLVGLPDVYLLLPLQSLVVVSMALWFRNRLIIVMNSLLFLFILLIYLTTSKPVNGVNFSFALVALVSARIINWKKQRLEIKTELMRNLYLVTGFIMVMFALLHAVPKQFVALSWTIAALIYFGLSFVLKNVKYRYMALGTMISAAVYLFLVDLARIEVIYRVLALLFLAAVSIGISIYYSNRVRKSED